MNVETAVVEVADVLLYCSGGGGRRNYEDARMIGRFKRGGVWEQEVISGAHGEADVAVDPTTFVRVDGCSVLANCIDEPIEGNPVGSAVDLFNIMSLDREGGVKRVNSSNKISPNTTNRTSKNAITTVVTAAHTASKH